jgi:hypothetical protein
MRDRRGLGDEQLEDGARIALRLGQGLADRLPSLGQEGARVVPAAAAGQLARSGDPRRALAQQRKDPVPLTPRTLGASLWTGLTGVRVARGNGVLFPTVLGCYAAAAPVACGFAASAARADSTSEAKAAGSLTASSARTLRSSSMPASLRPCMNRL